MDKASLIVGNWKMHKTAQEAKEHLLRLKALLFRSLAEVWVAVPFTAISIAVEAVKGSKIQIGGQNMSDLLEGALTGEISASMLLEAGATFVILGHSERRRIFREDNFTINRKVKLALRMGLSPILCIGETKEENAAGETEKVLYRQLRECLKGVAPSQADQLIIAYEPVFAIGTKEPAGVEVVEEIHHLCKNFLAEHLQLQEEKTRVLYGGSINAANAGNFLTLPHVDGLLVGGASLDVQSFAEIVYQVQNGV